MNFKDKISLLISIVALLMSGTVAYYNLFRVRHDVKVSFPSSFKYIDLSVDIESDDGYELLAVSARQSFTIVNSGNKPVAVTAIRLIGKQTKSAGQQDVCAIKTNEFGMPTNGDDVLALTTAGQDSFQRVVVKAGDIVATDVEFKKGAQIPLVIGDSDPNGKVFVTLCYEFDFLIPEGAQRSMGAFVESAVANTKGERRTTYTPGPYRRGALFTLIDE